MMNGTNLLPRCERQILVLDHVHDLALHGDEEQYKPVEQQDRPEDRHVAEAEERECEPKQDRLGRRPPGVMQSKALSKVSEQHQRYNSAPVYSRPHEH